MTVAGAGVAGPTDDHPVAYTGRYLVTPLQFGKKRLVTVSELARSEGEHRRRLICCNIFSAAGIP